MTGIPVDHRFENHKNGYKSAWVVRKYGVRLMPELYEHLNPMPFEAAVQMESELAEDLRASGYTVTGGHSPAEFGRVHRLQASRPAQLRLQRNKSTHAHP